MKSKALQEIIRGLKTEDKSKKIQFIKLLGDTVTMDIKGDTEQKAIDALQEETQSKSLRVSLAAKWAIKKIRNTKRTYPNPLDMFDGGVSFSSNK